MYISIIELTKQNTSIMDMLQPTDTPKLIDKEEIEHMKFPQQGITRAKGELEALMRKLNEAMTLGNVHHSKIKIIFHDSEGLKAVETTVWVAGDDYITLKKGVSIPIRNIVDVKF